MVLGFHEILKNVTWYHLWTVFYWVGELENNYVEFNENYVDRQPGLRGPGLAKSSRIKI